MADAEIISLDSRARASATSPQERMRCRATTSSGRPCRNYALDERGYCRVHAAEEPPESLAGESSVTPGHGGVHENQGLGEFLRRRLAGEYEVDEFGYDRELSRELLLPLAKPLYDRYFRVRTLGMSRIPDEGPALLVANHSGTVALDAVILQYAVATEHPQRRAVRNVAADLVFRLPFVGPLARKTGNVLAHDEDALQLIKRGELVGIFPEGYKGVGKGWSERYKLQRFGRGGFIETALRTKAPIIPVAIVGAEEAYPMIGNAKLLARAFGLPYFPITPTFPWLGPLGAVPFPSRWVIEFGEPIRMDEYPDDAADDKMLVFDLSDGIRDTIQQMLYKLLKFRGGTFL